MNPDSGGDELRPVKLLPVQWNPGSHSWTPGVHHRACASVSRNATSLPETRRPRVILVPAARATM